MTGIHIENSTREHTYNTSNVQNVAHAKPARKSHKAVRASQRPGVRGRSYGRTVFPTGSGA